MRLKALEIFTRGKPYFELIGQPGDGLSAEEVAQEVSELMGHHGADLPPGFE